jgi:hypothetical protein
MCGSAVLLTEDPPRPRPHMGLPQNRPPMCTSCQDRSTRDELARCSLAQTMSMCRGIDSWDRSTRDEEILRALREPPPEPLARGRWCWAPEATGRGPWPLVLGALWQATWQLLPQGAEPRQLVFGIPGSAHVGGRAAPEGMRVAGLGARKRLSRIV